jgi:hypothetical protein
LEYTNKLNRLLSKQSDALAEALRFYGYHGQNDIEKDQGHKARQVLKEWYDL